MSPDALSDELIPPLALNYNWTGTDERAYRQTFGIDYLNNILPRCLEILGGEFYRGTILPKILDIGCGFAPMARALEILADAARPLNSHPPTDTRYVGIDIREDAVRWLQQAYRDHTRCLFHLHNAPSKVDYIGEFKIGRDNTAQTSGASDGSECNFQLPTAYTADLQWSSSFFTHLTPQAVERALGFIAHSLSAGAVAINTWLLVDTHSCLAMATKSADRQLPHDFGDYLTYAQDNPLVCTAYKLGFVIDAYKRAGLEIVSMERGHWRGGSTRNLFGHYQDVVIARKR